MSVTLRPALPPDHSALYRFVTSQNHIHRHLDWRDALEWLGREPFWLMEEEEQISAVLACPPEPEEVAWVRLFAASIHTSPDRAWNMLFECALKTLRQLTPRPAIVSLAMREWYEDLLQRKGFIHHQDIVVFLFDQQPPAPPTLDSAIQVREMEAQDLPAVYHIDNEAFEPIWRLSHDDLRFAYEKSTYCTVAERDGQLIGYSMSSSAGTYAHLARLAVARSARGQRIGYGLLHDLLKELIEERGHWGVTLNTQHDNHDSLALYHKTGFRETGERFPVFIYPD